MIASAHVAAGAVVGGLALRMRAPTAARVLVAMVIGAGGHLAMDAIPHSDYAFLDLGEIPWVGLGEALFACGIVWFIARGHVGAGRRLPLVVGVASAMAPDVKFVARVLAPPYETPISRITDAIHGLHASGPLHVWLAFCGEVLLAVAFFYVFWRMIRGVEAPRPGRSTAAAVPPSAA